MNFKLHSVYGGTKFLTKFSVAAMAQHFSGPQRGLGSVLESTAHTFALLTPSTEPLS